MSEGGYLHFVRHTHGFAVLHQQLGIALIMSKQAYQCQRTEAAELSLADDERPQIVAIEQTCKCAAILLYFCDMALLLQNCQHECQPVNVLGDIELCLLYNNGNLLPSGEKEFLFIHIVVDSDAVTREIKGYAQVDGELIAVVYGANPGAFFQSRRQNGGRAMVFADGNDKLF